MFSISRFPCKAKPFILVTTTCPVAGSSESLEQTIAKVIWLSTRISFRTFYCSFYLFVCIHWYSKVYYSKASASCNCSFRKKADEANLLLCLPTALLLSFQNLYVFQGSWLLAYELPHVVITAPKDDDDYDVTQFLNSLYFPSYKTSNSVYCATVCFTQKNQHPMIVAVQHVTVASNESNEPVLLHFVPLILLLVVPHRLWFTSWKFSP